LLEIARALLAADRRNECVRPGRAIFPSKLRGDGFMPLTIARGAAADITVFLSPVIRLRMGHEDPCNQRAGVPVLAAERATRGVAAVDAMTSPAGRPEGEPWFAAS
jgi:hypothetical protein